MAVFYKYQYTNKRKNIHPCFSARAGRQTDGSTKGNTRGPRGHKKNAKCKTIKRTSNRSTNIKSSHLNSRRYGKKGEKKECKIQNQKKALQPLHQHRISKKLQKEKD